MIRSVASLALVALSLSACSGSSPVLGEPSAATGESPFVVSDCGVGAPGLDANAAPGSGITNGPITVVLDGNAPPIVAVAANAAPAQELVSQDLVPGKGPGVVASDVITVQYCGVGLSNRQIFDSSWISGQPLSIGLAQLIPGWQQGLIGLQPGGTRLLVIPGQLAYGANPPPGIAPNETLVFVVQLQAVNAAG